MNKTTRQSHLNKAMGLLAVATLSFPIASWAFSIGELAENIMAPTAFVTKFIIFGCYAVGIALALAGVMQFKNHKQNPKLVPLSIPIVLFILSGVLLVLPFLSKQGGASWSASEKEKQEQTSTPSTSPFSGTQQPGNATQSPAPSNTPSQEQQPPAQEENSHWGTRPEYQH